MTKLDAYLKSNQITQADFADMAGLDQSTVSRLCAGKISATVDTAMKIEDATGRVVKFSDLMKRRLPTEGAANA